MQNFLETKRLLLRLTDRDDLEDLYALRSNKDVMKYSGKSVQTRDEVIKALDIVIPYQEKHGFGFCSVFEKETEEFVGQAGIFHVGFYDKQPEIELGYRLHKKFWGLGYATELSIALIDWAFSHTKISKLVAFAHPDNKASHRVLEKANMKYLGLVDSYYGKVDKYEITRLDST